VLQWKKSKKAVVEMSHSEMTVPMDLLVGEVYLAHAHSYPPLYTNRIYESGRPMAGLVYVREGSAEYVFEDGSLSASAGMLLFLPRGCAYRIQTEKEHFSHYTVNFDAAVSRGEGWRVLRVEGMERACPRMERLVAHFREGRRESLLSCRAELYRLLAMLAAEGDSHSALRALLSPAVERLRDREALPIPALAALCHMSVTHFRRQFQKAFGESPLQYRNRFLAERGKDLLEEGLSVKEIAYLLGVADAAYFSRLFRKQVGLSPEEFRRLL
jgi:AraC-like DNA-binding protein